MPDDPIIVSTYTNQNAIDDGIFMNVSNIARTTGFLLPFYVTSNLWYHLDRDKNGGEELINLLILFNAKVHRGDVDGTMAVVNHNDQDYWLFIEGTSKDDAIMKMMLPEDY